MATSTSDATSIWSQIPSDPRAIEGIEKVPSPALLIFWELVEQNIKQMIAIATSPHRLRPHCKTHKLSPIIRRELELGINKHKCATIAEAEMLAISGATDIFLAYPPVGPNIDRIVELAQQYPQVTWRVTGDHRKPIEALAQAAQRGGVTIGVMIDLDPGMHRTGIAIDARAADLFREVSKMSGLRADGFQLYDGHHRQLDVAERQAAVQKVWDETAKLADALESEGLGPVRVVAGGTGSFPCFARIDDERLELSPGTVVFHDAGYLRAFPDLHFTPAAVLLTRVIDLPFAGRITVDLGHKAVAADPGAGNRTYFPALSDAKEVMHSEEHLVLETAQASSLEPGDPLFAIPIHVCPTTALHQEVIVIRNQRVSETWPVDARNRRLSI